MEAIFETLNVVARDFWGVWLMGCFILVILFAFHPSRRKQMQRYGEIPLRDDDALPGKEGSDADKA